MDFSSQVGKSDGIEQKFQDQLSREILLSQRLRASVLIGLAGGLALFLLVAFAIVKLIIGGEFLPRAAVPLATGMVIYHWLMRQYIDQQIREERAIKSRVWYYHAAIEISVITCFVIVGIANGAR